MSFTESLRDIISENSNQILGQHPTWERVLLSDVASIQNGFPFASDSFSPTGLGTPLIRIRDILRNATETFFMGEFDPAFLVRQGDLLVGMDGDFNSSIWQGTPGLLNQRCCRITVESRYLDKRLLAYCLPGYLAAINAHTSSITVKHLSSRTIAEIPLPLPPLPEQSRIADTLDELFSDLDAGIEALTRVREKLKLYRASVLKAAVEGTLTAEWRAQHPKIEPAPEFLKRILAERRRHWEEERLRKFKNKGQEPPKNWKDKYKEPVAPDTSELPSLPEGWSWASLDQVGRLDRGRSKHRPRDAEFLYGGPYPFIQTGDVRKARQYLREHSQTYSEAGLMQSRLWSAETLCITIAANIAETAILSYPACFPDSIVGVIFESSHVSVRYVELFMRSARSQISAYAPATAQKNINNEILRAVAIPLPPFKEQLAIVDAAEDQLSTIDHLDDDIEVKFKNVHALRQAILRHAFTGHLVPQDPNDEPAPELLKRIVAEREQRTRDAKTAKRTTETAKRVRTKGRGHSRPADGRQKKKQQEGK